MNKILLLIALSFSVPLTAQETEEIKLSYENGESFTIGELDTDPNNFPHSEIYIGGFSYEGLIGVGGYIYTKPKKYQIKSLFGTNGFSGELSYYFKSYTKTAEKELVIHSKYLGSKIDWELKTQTLNFESYTTTLPTKSVRSIGLAAGAEYYSLKKSSFFLPGINDYNVFAFTVGFSMLSIRHQSLLFNNSFTKRQAISSRLFVGAVFLNSELVENTGIAPVEQKNIVPRITYEISFSFGSSGRGGFKFLIGYQTPSGAILDSKGIIFGAAVRRTFG